MNNINEENSKIIENFRQWLFKNDVAFGTICNYCNSLRELFAYCGKITEDKVIEWKSKLKADGLKPATINAKLAAINKYFAFAEIPIKVKYMKVQKTMFLKDERLLHENEYQQILATAEKKNVHALYVLQTIAVLGIRVSELRFVTFESVKDGYIEITQKGKTRIVPVPKKLKRRLMEYAKSKGIKSGILFLGRNKKAVSRKTIWYWMKKFAGICGINKEKSFPHNLRHLFARKYYQIHKNIVALSSLLGHSNLETTRVYLLDTWEKQREILEKMELMHQEKESTPENIGSATLNCTIGVTS